jgi:nucleoside-diphosphate-sugar epimerase
LELDLECSKIELGVFDLTEFSCSSQYRFCLHRQASTGRLGLVPGRVTVKVFIAGATGVLGRRLVRQLLKRGHAVTGLARNASNEEAIRSLGGEPRVGELFNSESLARAAESADVIIHAATSIPLSAKPSPKDWEMNNRIRVDGTRTLAEAAARVGAKMFVVQSVTWVARPADGSAFDENSPFNSDPILRTAGEMETIAREAGTRNGFGTAILRCSMFHSPDAGHTRAFGKQLAARKLPIIVSKGGKSEAVWSLVHVDDAASAFVAAAEAGRSGLWHVTDNQPVPSEEYLREMAKRIGAPEPRRVPEWLAKWVAGESAVNFMTASTRTSNARFCSDFGWSPRFPGYREALDEIISAWRAEKFLGLGKKAAA